MTPPAASAPSPSPLDQLAARIHGGEVVFFVGAGFSIDSEGLSAELIIKRLLLRLVALDRLQADPGHSLRRLAAVFGVADSLAGLAATVAFTRANRTQRLDSHLARLAARYYELNSWLCQAFGELLLGATPTTPADFAAALAAADRDALAESTWAENDWYRARLAFSPLPETWWHRAHSHRADAAKASPTTSPTAVAPEEIARLGKLVFIHGTGLFDPAIMGGEPYAHDRDPDCPLAFARAYGDRLRPRHHVIARLAREGLCPTVVTTNFDLLLEGAFRLAGFRSAQPRPPSEPPIPTALPRFDVIASPEAFFTRGKAYRTATVIKLHGCAGQLRRELAAPDALDSLARYLPQLVYTYREIQNWRDDSWAAEFLRTLLRTRSFVFSGYSTADPVLHDTFRGVYEEMARKLVPPSPSAAPSPPSSSPPTPPPAAAPAYFFAYTGDEETQEFAANEVLASASRAVGAPTLPLGHEHPNYLRFAPEWNALARRLRLDELMLWLQHGVLRRQQAAALRHDLPGLAAGLVGRRPRTEFDQLARDFDALVAAESSAVNTAFLAPPASPGPHIVFKKDIAAARRTLAAATAWSHGFHPALRREWAHAAALLRSPATFRAFAELEHPLWYYPAAERPEWTAWSAVLELALRRLAHLALEHWSGAPAAAASSAPSPAATADTVGAALLDAPLAATLAPKPTVLLKRHAGPAAPLVALTLQIRDHSRRVARRPECPGFPSRHAVWLMPEDAVPWSRSEPVSSAAGSGPHASALARPPRAADAPEDFPDLAQPYRIGAAQWSTLPPARLIWDLALGRAFPPDTVRHLVSALLLAPQ